MIPITAVMDPQIQIRFTDWALFNTLAKPDKSIDSNAPAEFEVIPSPAVQGVNAKSLKWTDGAVRQVQPDQLPDGAEYNVELDNANRM